MKLSSSLIAVIAATTSASISAFIPAHLDLLTETELDNITGKSGELHNARRLEESTESLIQSATGDASSDDESVTELSFDPPLKFGQYSTDTCDDDSVVYTGEINKIKLLTEGEFCITDTVGGDLSYTKLVNKDCSIFGVQDVFTGGCTDEDCGNCPEDANDSFLGITLWEQVFPLPFEGHCFQQIFSANGETFDESTDVDIDYQYLEDTNGSGLEYKKFIVKHSCIKDFVQSDSVEFSEDSVTETDEDGDSISLNTDGDLTITDGDTGGSIIIDGEDGDVTIEGGGGALTVENANTTFTEDGGLTIENDDVSIVFDSDGNSIVTTTNYLSYSDGTVFVTLSNETVTFGSSSTGEYFEYTDVETSFTDDEGIMLDFDDSGYIIFYNNSVAFSDSDGKTFTLPDPEYNYTDGAFWIFGTTDEGDKFLVGFNDEGAVASMEGADEFITATSGEGFFLATDDVFIAGDTDGNTAPPLRDPTYTTDDEGVTVSGTTDDGTEVDVTASSSGGVTVTADDKVIYSASGDDDGSCKTVSELLCNDEVDGSFTVFCDFWDAIDSSDDESLTIFVPTDNAFNNLFDLLESADVTLDDETLGEVFLFHAVSGKVTSADLKCGGTIDMVAGGSSRTKCGNDDNPDTPGVDFYIQKGGGNRKNDIDPVIVYPDIMACNDSVLHIINEVMLPNSIDAL